MPIFSHSNDQAEQLRKINFKNEKELQNFIEKNLEELFGIRFLATEFTTSKQHGGRIDSLGIDDNDNPVIIEYKWGEKNNIINQGLFYLDWLIDHKGDFKLLVQEKLGNFIKVDFSSPRVLLIAQTFNKYDKYAIKRMSENIELWGYSKYSNDIFELKLIASTKSVVASTSKKQISKVNYKNYLVSDHFKNKPEETEQLFKDLQEKIFNLEAEQTIEEIPQKLYIAYRASKIFIQVWIKKHSISINFKTKMEDFKGPHNHLKNVSDGVKMRGVFCEFIIKNFEDIDVAMTYIEQSYQQSI